MKFKQIKLEGNLVFSAPLAKQQIRDAADTHNVEIDFTDVGYIDSTGISMILDLEKKIKHNGGRLRLIGVRKSIADILEASGMDKIAEIRSITEDKVD